MAINTPNSGEKILPWAKEATREINSLRPTSGNGIRITKTNAGTTFSLEDSARVCPDSMPAGTGGAVLSGFTTTYSLEKSPQNALALFGFSDLSTKFNYRYEHLSALELVMRDLSTEYAVLSAPTVRYWNFLSALSTWAGDRGDDDNGSPGQEALSVIPDSEILEPITYSIQHNISNVNELELYRFHNGQYSVSSSIDTLLENHDEVLIRQAREDELGNPIRKLAYIDLNKVLSAGDSMMLNRHFKVTYDSDFDSVFVNIETLDAAVLINGAFIPTDDQSLHLGENNMGRNPNIYVNIYETNAGTPTDIVNGYVWRLETSNGQLAPVPPRWSLQLAHIDFEADPPEVMTYRDCVIEVGALLPDSADQNPVGQGQHRTRSLEFTDGSNMGAADQAGKVSKSGLRLYGFAPQALNGGIGGNEQLNEWFWKTMNGDKADGALALMYRDVDDGNGQTNLEQGTLKYLPLDDINRLIITDTDCFRIQKGYSRSIQNIGETVGQTLLGIGSRLYKFFEIEPVSPSGYTYSYPVDSVNNVSAYSDVVIRKRHTGTGGVPEVSYIPLSSVLSGGGGEGHPLDGEEEDVGYSINLNSEGEEQIYGFEDADNHRADEINYRRHDFILRYKPSNYRNPEVQYAKLSAVEAVISADFGLDDGYTGEVKYVLSSSYSNSTHKFINHIATMRFENGILKWNDTTHLTTQEVYQAVEEEL
jgi:hypothetical protein